MKFANCVMQSTILIEEFIGMRIKEPIIIF
jgi:hypothetical protein